MKKLTDTQKKWALTACLASVLSLNMALNLTNSDYGTASFASEKEKVESTDGIPFRYESLISDQGEELKVKYVHESDDNTVAIVPEKLESGLCYSCGNKYLLPKNFDSSAASLEMALRKAMSRGAKVTNIQKEVVSSEGEDLDKKIASKNKPVKPVKEETEEEEVAIHPDIIALQKRCDKKEDDSRVHCFANGLTKLLKDKKKDFKKDEVMNLFREEIEPGIKAGLADISDLIPKRRLRNDPFGDLDSVESTRREDTQSLVEDMLGQINKKYNYLRQRLTSIAAKAVLSNEEQAQMKLKQAEQMRASDPARALNLQQEGYARMNAANQIATQIGGTLYSGLETAQWNNHINLDQFDTLYNDHYANIVNAAIKGLTANPLTYVIPSVTLSDGSVIVDQAGQSFTLTPSAHPLVKQRTGGRGITVITNSLTPANAPTSQTPRIAVVNGSQTAGVATIHVFQAPQAPSTSQPAQLQNRGR